MFAVTQFMDLPWLWNTSHGQLVPPQPSDANARNHTPVTYPQATYASLGGYGGPTRSHSSTRM